MKRIYNKFLIISTFIFLIGGACLYFGRDLNSKSIVPVAYGSSLASSTGAVSTSATSSVGTDIASDISFLTTLVSLKKIKIDTSLFSNESFNRLQNNSVKIEPVKAGRLNPFAPMDSVGGNSFASMVVTNQPSQITDKTVIFNGTINTISGVTDTYFQYGVSDQSLNSTTTPAKQSLVGTFVKNVSGLTPQTTYFFKACAKINNVALCGEVISFTTK